MNFLFNLTRAILKDANSLSAVLLNWRFYFTLAATCILGFTLTVGLQLIGVDRIFLGSLFQIVLFIGPISITIGFFLFIAERLQIVPKKMYINPDLTAQSRLDDIIHDVSNYEERFSILQQHVDALTARNLDETSDFLASMEPELDRLTKVYFETEVYRSFEIKLKEDYGENFEVGHKIKEIKLVFDKSVDGMKDQLDKQRANSNTNLLIGLVFSATGIIAMGYLFYVAYFSEKHIASIDAAGLFIMGFIPRLTFVILVETVAFFFLNLYREDRNMIRYFRNEITNFEAKFLALEAAARFADKSSLTKALAIFTSMERNFLIKKGDKLVTEALRESDDRMFDKIVDKLSNNFDLSKIKRGG